MWKYFLLLAVAVGLGESLPNNQPVDVDGFRTPAEREALKKSLKAKANAKHALGAGFPYPQNAQCDIDW